ncbi:MAG: hypothetical protein PHX86_06345 [Caldisericia bacterium]|nr:hypothetical protein [Caldisericia bacterium]
MNFTIFSNLFPFSVEKNTRIIVFVIPFFDKTTRVNICSQFSGFQRHCRGSQSVNLFALVYILIVSKESYVPHIWQDDKILPFALSIIAKTYLMAFSLLQPSFISSCFEDTFTRITLPYLEKT